MNRLAVLTPRCAALVVASVPDQPSELYAQSVTTTTSSSSSTSRPPTDPASSCGLRVLLLSCCGCCCTTQDEQLGPSVYFCAAFFTRRLLSTAEARATAAFCVCVWTTSSKQQQRRTATTTETSQVSGCSRSNLLRAKKHECPNCNAVCMAADVLATITGPRCPGQSTHRPQPHIPKHTFRSGL